MDHWERRRLQEIEHTLETNDPRLAELLTVTPARTANSPKRHRMNELMMAGGCLSVLGLLVHPLLFAVGLSILLTAFWMRVGMASHDRQTTERDSKPGEDGDNGGTSVPLR